MCNKTSVPERKEVRRCGKDVHPESHGPLVGWELTPAGWNLVPTRLSWRHRARPSATLHEIQVCSRSKHTQSIRTSDGHCQGPAFFVMPSAANNPLVTMQFNTPHSRKP